MVKIRLLDEGWRKDMENCLVTAYEGITDLDRDVRGEKGYRELEQAASRIEGQAAGTPAADMLLEYRDAAEDRTGYLHIAAYLKGVRIGFRLAMSHYPDGKAGQAAGRRDG